MQDTQHAVLAGEDGDQLLHVLRRQTQDVVDLVSTQQVVAVLAVVVVVVHKVTAHKQLRSLHCAAQQQTNKQRRTSHILSACSFFSPFFSSCIPCTVFNILTACISLLPEHKVWCYSITHMVWMASDMLVLKLRKFFPFLVNPRTSDPVLTKIRSFWVIVCPPSARLVIFWGDGALNTLCKNKCIHTKYI